MPAQARFTKFKEWKRKLLEGRDLECPDGRSLYQYRLSREEFDEFYSEHHEDFRGPDQVRLTMIIVDEEATAQEVVARLAAGAAFEYLAKQYQQGGAELGSSTSDWAPANIFSADIQSQLEGLEVGASSEPVAMATGWIVFKLDDRRAGELATMEQVEMQIRQVMFQRKFNDQLDEHLELLNARSDIVRNKEAVDRYFGSELEG